MIKRIIVLGGGSAGFLAAITLKSKLPALAVVMIRSKEIGIIGVGEGTTVSVPNYLHGYLKIDPIEFHRIARPTFKLGIKYLWGPRPFFHYTFSPQFDMQYQMLSRPTGFYCREDEELRHSCSNAALMSHDKAFVRLPDGSPGIRNDVAYHIENADLVALLEMQAKRVGVEIVDDTVADVTQGDRGIESLHCTATGVQRADLYVDSSGFNSLLLSKALAEPLVSFKSSLFCDRAVVGGWARPEGEEILPYTTAETMDAGWCWKIEHENRVNRGYVHSSAFISDDAAEAEFRRKNPKVETTRIVKFVSGRYERAWVKNVVGIGNANGFVEPLESTSLAMICEQCHMLTGSLADCGLDPGPAMAAVFNHRSGQSWDSIRQFLAVHYKFNTRLDTPFWKAAVADVNLAGAEQFVEYFQENGPSTIWKHALIQGRDVFGYEGYLAMMVGQKVPYRRRFQPDEREARIWHSIQQANRAEGESGLTVRQTLAAIRSPLWQSRADFYRFPYQ